MLQRSPSYVVTLPAEDPIAEVLTRSAAREGRLRDRPLEERAADDAELQPEPPLART